MDECKPLLRGHYERLLVGFENTTCQRRQKKMDAEAGAYLVPISAQLKHLLPPYNST